MKKLLFMLMGVAATINVMAVDYTAKANILLQATSGEDCEMYLRQSDSYGALEGYDMYMNNREVALYAINGNQKLQMAKAADLTNLPLGLKTDVSTSYTITVSGVEGSETLYLWDWDFKSYALTEGASYTFDAEANATIENRFSIHKVVPVQLKGEMVGTDCGANQNEWCDEALTVSANNETASYSQNITAGWYNFGLYINGVYKNNKAEFSRDNNEQGGFSYDDQNSWMYADIDGEYTFTWNYATQKLTITYPAAPAPTYAAEVTTNAYGLATFSFDQPLAPVEAGVKLYKGAISGNDLNLTQVADYAAEQGVVVYGEANTTYHFAAINGATADFSGNELKAASTWAYPHAGTTAYVLSGSSLYIYEGENMKPNKAFLLLEANSGNAPRRISFRFNGTTAFENVEMNEAKAVKFMEDGKVFIKRGDAIYNLQGQLVK